MTENNNERGRQALLRLARRVRNERQFRDLLRSSSSLKQLKEQLAGFFEDPLFRQGLEQVQQWRSLVSEAELELQREEAKSQQSKEAKSTSPPSAALSSETPSIEPLAEQLREAGAELQAKEESAATATNVYRPAPEADIHAAITDAHDAAEASGHDQLSDDDVIRQEIRRANQESEQLREAEAELQAKEESAALSSETPSIEPPAEPISTETEIELKPANDKCIRQAITVVYSRYALGEGPSLADIVPLVNGQLKLSGHKASKGRIQGIAGDAQFDGKRRPQGQRRN